MISRYISTIKDYFLSKKLLLLSFFSLVFIYLLHFFLDMIFESEKFYFIYWQFIQPFFVYISMIFVMYYYSKNILCKKKYQQLSYKEILIIFFLFLIKCSWNITEVIFLETDLVQTNENSKLYFLFILLFFWMAVYFASSFYLPKQFLNDNKPRSFFDYIKKTIVELLLYFAFSVVIVFCIIYVISFIIAKFSVLFSVAHPKIHFFIEDIFGIYFFILLSHLVSIYFLRLYAMKFLKEDVNKSKIS